MMLPSLFAYLYLCPSCPSLLCRQLVIIKIIISFRALLRKSKEDRYQLLTGPKAPTDFVRKGRFRHREPMSHEYHKLPFRGWLEHAFEDLEFSNEDIHLSNFIAFGQPVEPQNTSRHLTRTMQERLIWSGIPAIRISEIREMISGTCAGLTLSSVSGLDYTSTSAETILYILCCLKHTPGDIESFAMMATTSDHLYRRRKTIIESGKLQFFDEMLITELSGIGSVLVERLVEFGFHRNVSTIALKHLTFSKLAGSGRIPFVTADSILGPLRRLPAANDFEPFRSVLLTLRYTNPASEECEMLNEAPQSKVQCYTVSLSWCLEWISSPAFRRNRGTKVVDSGVASAPSPSATVPEHSVVVEISSMALLVSLCMLIDTAATASGFSPRSDFLPREALSSINYGDILEGEGVDPDSLHLVPPRFCPSLLTAARILGNSPCRAVGLGSGATWTNEEHQRALKSMMKTKASPTFEANDIIPATVIHRYDGSLAYDFPSLLEKYNTATNGLVRAALASGLVVAAGGSVLGAMHMFSGTADGGDGIGDGDGNNTFEQSDIDLFPVGRPGWALKRVLDVVEVSLRRALPAGSKIMGVMSAYAISYYTPPGYRTVQVITRQNNSAEQVLHKFDLDCVCVALTKDAVVTLPRFHRALRSMLNVFDSNFTAPPYATRLAKYSRRGFGIAVVGLGRCTFGGNTCAHLFRLKSDAKIELEVTNAESNYCDEGDGENVGLVGLTPDLIEFWLQRLCDKLERLLKMPPSEMSMRLPIALCKLTPYIFEVNAGNRFGDAEEPYQYPNSIGKWCDQFKLPRPDWLETCEDLFSNEIFVPSSPGTALPFNEGRFRGVDPRDDWFLDYQCPAAGGCRLPMILNKATAEWVGGVIGLFALVDLQEEERSVAAIPEHLELLSQAKAKSREARRKLAVLQIDAEEGLNAAQESQLDELNVVSARLKRLIDQRRQDLLRLSIWSPEVFQKCPDLNVLFGADMEEVSCLAAFTDFAKEFEVIEIFSHTSEHQVSKVRRRVEPDEEDYFVRKSFLRSTATLRSSGDLCRSCAEPSTTT